MTSYMYIGSQACHIYSVHLVIFGDHAQALPREMKLDHIASCTARNLNLCPSSWLHAVSFVYLPRLTHVLFICLEGLA